MQPAAHKPVLPARDAASCRKRRGSHGNRAAPKIRLHGALSGGEDAGRPARSAVTRTSEKPASSARRAASSRQVSCSSKAKPPPSLRARRHQGSRRRSTSSPSAPPSSASAGSNSATSRGYIVHDGRGHVRRVGHHEVERAHERRIDALAQIARQHLDAVAQLEGSHVVASERDGPRARCRSPPRARADARRRRSRRCSRKPVQRSATP